MDIRLLKTNPRNISVLEAYHLQVGTAEDVLEENMCFEKQLKEDEAIRFKNVIGIDQQISALLLGVHLKIPNRFQANVDLHCRARKASLNFSDYIYLTENDKSNPGCLANTNEPDYQTVLLQLRPRIMSQCMLMMTISQCQIAQILKCLESTRKFGHSIHKDHEKF